MAEPLVPLATVEKLSSRVIRILGGNPGKVSERRLSVQRPWLTGNSLPCRVRRIHPEPGNTGSC